MLIDARRQQVEGFWAEIHSLESILMWWFIEKLDHNGVNVLFVIKRLEFADFVYEIEFWAGVFWFKLD